MFRLEEARPARGRLSDHAPAPQVSPLRLVEPAWKAGNRKAQATTDGDPPPARPKGPRWVTVAMVTAAYAAAYVLAWLVVRGLA